MVEKQWNLSYVGMISLVLFVGFGILFMYLGNKFITMYLILIIVGYVILCEKPKRKKRCRKNE
jgi:uncharacterized membrane protein